MQIVKDEIMSNSLIDGGKLISNFSIEYQKKPVCVVFDGEKDFFDAKSIDNLIEKYIKMFFDLKKNDKSKIFLSIVSKTPLYTTI